MDRILLMEDDIVQAEMLADGLRALGYHVYVTHSGLEAWEALNSEPYDVLITDLFVAGETEIALGQGGIALIAKIRGEGEIRHARDLSDLKIMALTGGGEVVKGYDVLNLASRFGADVCLKKPVGLKALASEVSRLLGER